VTREDFLVHVVDSDQAIADGLVTLLNAYGIEVLSYADAESFLKFWLPRRPCNGCLITEADAPGFSGLEFLRELVEMRVEIPVLLLVSSASPDLLEAVRGANQVGVVRKPCLDHTLVQRVLELREASPECQGSHQTLRQH
jgi:FixJ family two-component response regulator